MCLRNQNEFYLSQDPGKIYIGNILKDHENKTSIVELELIYEKKSKEK